MDSNLELVKNYCKRKLEKIHEIGPSWSKEETSKRFAEQNAYYSILFFIEDLEKDNG